MTFPAAGSIFYAVPPPSAGGTPASRPPRRHREKEAPVNELIAKPLAIATCGVFNMKRRAKEALRAQGSIEWIVIVVCIAVALIAALVLLSGEMNNKINTVANTLKNTTVNGAHAGK